MVHDEDLRLDGNAAAGMLTELFVPDLTTAYAVCANCGSRQAMGALLVYAHGMGMVIRCTHCDGAVLRVARTPTHLCLDMTGARLLVIASEPGTA